MAKTITVIRHGKSSAPVDGSFEADVARTLNEIGIGQAKSRRKALDNPDFDLVLVSPLSRTQETAMHLANVPQTEVKILPELGWEKDSAFYAAIDEAFKELGYVAFGPYRAHKHGQVMIDRGQETWEKIANFLMYGTIESVAVVGHAVMINALGLAATHGLPVYEKLFDETAFGECEGYTLTFDGNGNVAVELHRG